MRVLICDQESEMLETVARWFEVDTATSKVTCIDLMRANPFDVLIASERLSDGSGLELLSHVATRWPNTLRVLVIQPERLRLLRGKLAPFRLHATMRYPIEEDELEAVLNRMGERMETAEAEEETEAAADADVDAESQAVPQSQAMPQPRSQTVPQPRSRPASRSHAVSNPHPVAAPLVTSRVQKVIIPQVFATPPSATTRASAKPPAPAASRLGSSLAAAGASAATRSGATTPKGGSAPAALNRSVPWSATPPSTQKVRSAKGSVPLGAPLPSSPPPVRRKLGNYTPLGAPEDEKMRIVEREFDRTAAPLAARAIRAREEASRSRSEKEKLGTLSTHLRNTLKRLLKR